MTPGPVRWLNALRLRKPSPSQSVAWEIEHHLAERTERLIAEGWSEEEARAEAERRFGDPARYGPLMRRLEKRKTAMERRVGWLDFLRQSLRSVGRSARRYPGYTAGVVVTLALGIGANASMYAVIDRLLLQPPLHIQNPDSVRRVFLERPSPLTGETTVSSGLTYPDYVNLKADAGFESVAAYTSTAERTIGAGPTAFRARVTLVTSGFFPLLGVKPLRGRFFSSEESQPGQPLTAVISEELWRSAYGRDPHIVGRSVEITGRRYTVVGVAPRGFTGMSLEATDFWLPLEATHVAEYGEEGCLRSLGCWWLSAVARLKHDATEEAAAAQATRLHLAGRREMIDEGRYSDRARILLGPVVAARGPGASEEIRVARWLMGVSLLVLVIACANVANLLMVRGTRRRRETSVLLALGASRRRVVAQLVAESILLSFLGGVAALGLAYWGGAVVRSTLLPGVYFPSSALNARLISFTALAALVAGIASAMGPALQRGQIDIADALSHAERGDSARGSRIRTALTVLQAALSTVLLVGAGLFVRSSSEVHTLDLGLDVDHVVEAQIEPRSSDASDQARNEMYEEALRRVSALPGVRSAAAAGVPFLAAYRVPLRVPGLDSLPTLPGGGPYYDPVSPGYFGTVGTRITRGRPITADDGPDDRKVAVVSQTMAAALWSGADPLGLCLLVGAGAKECTTVVGVAEDASLGHLEEEPFMAYYVPAVQFDLRYQGLFVRVDGDAAALVRPISKLLRSFSPSVRYARVQTLRQMMDPQARSWRLGATMFSIFGFLALLLAAIGLYSVLSFDVAQRTREMGIRSALGAEKGILLRSVLVHGARLGTAGVLLGIAVAYVAGPFASDLLFHVSPRDPEVLGAVVVTLVATSIMASLVPGLRATRVDPMRALRTE